MAESSYRPATYGQLADALKMPREQLLFLLKMVFADHSIRCEADKACPPDQALVAVLADFLGALGLSQEHRITALAALLDGLHVFATAAYWATENYDEGEKTAFPICSLELVDNRIAVLATRAGEERAAVAVEIATGEPLRAPPTAPPVLSIAINVTAIWLKTVARLFGRDDVAEAFSAGRLKPQDGGARIRPPPR